MVNEPSSKDIKLEEIKKHSPELYEKVVSGKKNMTDAYNEVMQIITDTSEYKGRGTRGKNKPGLEKEIERIMKMYKPSLKELLKAIKKHFPFTFDKTLQESLKK